VRVSERERVMSEGRLSRLFIFAKAGLPDGLLSNQKSRLGYVLEGLAMENVFMFLWPFGQFFGHLAYFTYVHLVYFCGHLV
jgi:hypothetical protein